MAMKPLKKPSKKLTLITTKQAALVIEQQTGKTMSIRQICREIKVGNLVAHKIANSYLIDPSDLKKYRRGKVGRPKNKS